MLIATWILAIATVVIALSVPVAWFTWLSTRRQDRERAQREREEAARQQALKDASEKFVSKDTAQGVAVLAALAAVLGGMAWFGRDKP